MNKKKNDPDKTKRIVIQENQQLKRFEWKLIEVDTVKLHQKVLDNGSELHLIDAYREAEEAWLSIN